MLTVKGEPTSRESLASIENTLQLLQAGQQKLFDSMEHLQSKIEALQQGSEGLLAQLERHWPQKGVRFRPRRTQIGRAWMPTVASSSERSCHDRRGKRLGGL